MDLPNSAEQKKVTLDPSTQKKKLAQVHQHMNKHIIDQNLVLIFSPPAA